MSSETLSAIAGCLDRAASDGSYEPSQTAPPVVRTSLGIVGNCPACGAPLYGRRTAFEGQTPPPIVYACDCRFRSP